MVASRILIRAADILASGEKQWLQDRMFEYDDKENIVACCALGAIVLAEQEIAPKPSLAYGGYRQEPYGARRLLKYFIKQPDIPEWNDREWRTMPQIVASMREAAKQ